jgi:hypothetical protein
MLGNINNGEAMKTKSIISLGLLAVFILSGCAVQIRPSLRIHLGTERIFDKNYNLRMFICICRYNIVV